MLDRSSVFGRNEDVDAIDARFAAGDRLTCDAESEGVAFCATDADLVFCSGGAWWALSCPALDSNAFCGIELSTATVDCWVP